MIRKNALETVVLAAGEGKRMLSDIPKVLHKVCGKPMLSYLLDTLEGMGIDRPIVVIGRGGDVVKKAYESRKGLKWALQKKQLGTAHALLSAMPAVKKTSGELLLLYGDAPLISEKTIRSFIDCHRSSGSALTVLTTKVCAPEGLGRVIRGNDGRFMGIVEHVNASAEERRITEINTGIYMMDLKACLPYIKAIRPDPVKKEYYLTDLVRMLFEADKPVGAHLMDDPSEFIGINTRAELAYATRYVVWRKVISLCSEGVTIMDPNSAYIEPDVEIGCDTVIFPFVVIRNGVKIGRGCEVGPFAHLRGTTVMKDGSQIGNFVEVKSSEVGRKTKAKHLAYIGDTRIGDKANIGAGTITANYDGFVKSRTNIGDGAFIGSGTILVAPVTVGRNAVTGAGSVVLKNRDVEPGTVVCGVPARKIAKKRPR